MKVQIFFPTKKSDIMSYSSKLNLYSAIENLPINPNIITKLKKANLLSFKKTLNFSLPELQRIAKLSAYEANIVCQAVSSAELNSSIVDAYSILTDSDSYREHVGFEFFKNRSSLYGIYTGTITEICGESGSGKTQLCLLLSICALMPKHLGGLDSKVIYIHSEGEFPIKRFVELSKAFKERNIECKDFNFTDNLILKKVFYLKEIMHVLQTTIPELLQKQPIPKVIIIDSVAALLRSEYDSFNLRNVIIKQLATELWKLANTYRIAIICVNQISGSVQRNDNSTSVSKDIPSLGLLWAHSLTTRLQISRKEPLEEPVRRQIEVVYSAYHPHLIIDFIITEKGIEVISERVI